MKSQKTIIGLSSAIIVSLALVSPLRAGTLAQEMKSKAGLIARYLESEGVAEVSMQPIDAPSLATGMNLIGVELEKHLASHKVTLARRAKLSIAIKVKFDKDKKGNPDGLEFNISLQDRLGDTLVDFVGDFSKPNGKTGFDKQGFTHAQIDDPDDVQHIVSVPVATHDVNLDYDMAPEGAKGKLGKAYKLKQIQESAANPEGKTFVRNGRVSSSSSHMFEIELVKTSSTDAKPAPNTYHSVPVSIDSETGMAVAKLEPGDNVGLRIYNNSSARVAVDATLDGISSFHFAPNVLPYYAVKSHSGQKPFLLRGFLQKYNASKSEASYTHFKIVQFEDTVWNQARKAGQSTSTAAFGSIAVHFHRELEKAPPKGRGNSGFGQGSEFKERVGTTKMHVGTIIETIVIQYQKPRD